MNKCTCGHIKKDHNKYFVFPCRATYTLYPCLCSGFTRAKNTHYIRKSFRKILKVLGLKGGENMKKYILIVEDDSQMVGRYDTLDEAREAVAEDMEDNELKADAYTLLEVSNSWTVIQPKKKVLFKKSEE